MRCYLGALNPGRKQWRCIDYVIMRTREEVGEGDRLVGAAESVIGYESRRQPDWYKDNASVLRELIERRNMLFGTWLKSGSKGNRQKYVSQRRLVVRQ